VARIFIVDDEPTLHELYGEILGFSGHEIVANAYNGDEAVEIFKGMDEPPEVIIMDHRMPNKDGVETTKEILKINPKIKIIFASADTSVKDAALKSGACFFLSKPFAMTDLLNEIEEMAAEKKRTEDHIPCRFG
jgi:two-component system chemotaxis response regulator CheY